MNHNKIIGMAGAERDGIPDPVPVSGLGGVLRRTIIACERAESLDDQLDCADMAFELGYADAARMLYEGVFLQRGFSAKQLAAQALIAARTGLWGKELPAANPAPVATAGFAIDLAIAELKQLMEQAPRLVPPHPGEAIALLPDLPLAVEVAAAKRAGAADATVVMDLSRRLCSSLQANDASEIDPVLEELRDGLLNRSEWHLRDHADASITDLAAGVAANQIRAFHDRNRTLHSAPFGSGALFWAAARLPAGGLGPYFTNVQRLLRSARDLIGTALLAGADDGGGHSLRFQQWLVLLAVHLDSGTRIMLVEEFADRGLDMALEGIFASAVQSADRGSRLPWIVRDAALDLGRVDLAAKAQARIAGLFPDRVEERIVLAEVLGGVDDAAARRALGEALRLEPEHEGALRLVVALETGGFGAFEMLSGLGSPPWRVALRAQYRRPEAQTGEAGPDEPILAAEQQF